MNITDCGRRHWKLFRSSNTYFIKTTWMCVLNWVGVSVWTNLHRVVRRSLILISIRYHWGAVEGRRRINNWWSLMCQSSAAVCVRGANDSCEHGTYWSRLQQIASDRASYQPVSMTTTSVTCEIRPAVAIQYLAYTGGDTEVILHLRQLLGVIFILAEGDREWKKACDAERRRK